MTTLLPNLDNPFNQQFGHPSDRMANKVKDTLPEPVKDFISQSPFIVMATSNREGWCDETPPRAVRRAGGFKATRIP